MDTLRLCQNPLPTVDAHQDGSSKEDVENILDIDMDNTFIQTERSLQTNPCGTVTQWVNDIVLELEFNSLQCFQGITPDIAIPLDNRDAAMLMRQLESVYTVTYNWMQGQNIKRGDHCMHCDPFARQITAASVQKLSRRRDSAIVAIEMKISSVCKGCLGLTSTMTTFDVPSASSKQQPTNNCACTTGVGSKLARAPYEQEFYAMFQQVVQSNKNACFQTSSSCSYGTPLELDIEMSVEVDGMGLTEMQRHDAAAAFMRASNTAYSASMANCQPEFRRLEVIKSAVFTTVGRHIEEDDAGRDLQQRRLKMILVPKTGGTCNACTGKAHVTDRADNRNIFKPKVRQLQTEQVYDASNCFCPLGSAVAREPIGRATVTRLFLEELALINSPIKNVTFMGDIGSKTR